MKLPKFIVYGKNDPVIEDKIQPKLEFRSWIDLSREEKEIALQQIKNSGWIDEYSENTLKTIADLNYHFLRECPGKRLHRTQPERDYRGMGSDFNLRKAAYADFQEVFLDSKSEPMVFRMLTKFAEGHIDSYSYHSAEQAKEKIKQKEYVEKAFEKFDRLANCFNHIFEQFAVNAVMTRSGLVPRQDKKITEEIYTPVLQVLSDPKWKSVSSDLAEMFEDYTNKNYSEAITKAHRAVQRFLQITAGEEGKNSKGEIGKLFNKIKQENLIPANNFTTPLINVFQAFISSERAKNSTAKPSIKKATSSDALLMMNVVMLFLQHCLSAE